MKRIYFNEKYCMACRLCEIACLVAHSKSKKIIKAYKEEYPFLKPRLIVEEKGPVSFAIQCRHCKDAPCVSACVSGAMRRHKSGKIIHNETKCVGCWMCVMVCPFGVIIRDLKGKKVAAKCDLCSDLGQPACVDACPNAALVYCEDKDNEKQK